MDRRYVKKPRRATLPRSIAIVSDAIDLIEVQQVVAGVEAHQVTCALFAALGMHADTLQILGRGALDQPQVVAPQHAQRLERLAGIRVGVVQPLGPQILVVAGDRRPILREDQPHPPSPHHVGIGQVPQHLRDRPLAGRLRRAQLFGRQRRHGPGRRGRRFAEDVHRLAAADQPEHGRRVLAPVSSGGSLEVLLNTDIDHP